jgi:hypothetical protein
MDALPSRIEIEKAELDRLRPLALPALAGLQKFYDVELTHSSNAIEGYTLTLRETAELTEHGITVGGKTLRDHLEAVDHYEALLWKRDLAGRAVSVDEAVVRELPSAHRRPQPARHRRFLQSSAATRRRLRSAASQPGRDPDADEGFGCPAHGRATRSRDGIRRPYPVDRHPPVRRRQRTHGTAPDESASDPRRLAAVFGPAGRPEDLSG